MALVTLVRRMPLVFPLACVAAVAMVLISEAAHWQSIDALDNLGAIQVGRASLRNLQQNLLVAETGQRGYLLTSRREYLQPYATALQEIDAALKTLDRYYGDKPAAVQSIQQLHSLIESRLSELALTIRMRDEGQAEAAMQIVLSNIGREKMEGIQALGAELLAAEDQLVAAARHDLKRTLMLSRIGMAALSAVGLLALYLYLRQMLLLKGHQLALKHVAQAERDRLGIEVKQRTAELTELTRHLLSAREDERNRLARNLHDELGSLLTSAKLDAARIKSRLAGTAPEALERLAHLVGTLNSSIAVGRRIIEDLRPSTLGNLGLVPTLEILAREFAEQSGIEVECDLAPVRLAAPAELMVYRLVQEAVTNIAKYAKASHVWIHLAAHDGVVEVSVRDDGVGFDTSAKTRSAYGLMGMRHRVEADGGALTLVSAPGQGTLIQAKLPESPPAAA
jgi:signal transduction histidine kinase